MSLPPLPCATRFDHLVREVKFIGTNAYTNIQMEDYGRACREAALEEAIRAVDSAGGDNADYHMDAIRALQNAPDADRSR